MTGEVSSGGTYSSLEVPVSDTMLLPDLPDPFPRSTLTMDMKRASPFQALHPHFVSS